MKKYIASLEKLLEKLELSKYQTILIMDKNINGLLLRDGCGINELKRKFRRKENNRKTLC